MTVFFNIQSVSKTPQLIMASQKDEPALLDARLWMACTLLGVLLSFMIFSYPGI